MNDREILSELELIRAGWTEDERLHRRVRAERAQTDLALLLDAVVATSLRDERVYRAPTVNAFDDSISPSAA